MGIVAEVIATVAHFATGYRPVIGAQAVIIHGFDLGMGVTMHPRYRAERSRAPVVVNVGTALNQNFFLQARYTNQALVLGIGQSKFGVNGVP